MKMMMMMIMTRCKYSLPKGDEREEAAETSDDYEYGENDWVVVKMMMVKCKSNLPKGDEEEEAAKTGEEVATVQEQGLNF